jgi:hypothetical protein
MSPAASDRKDDDVDCAAQAPEPRRTAEHKATGLRQLDASSFVASLPRQSPTHSASLPFRGPLLERLHLSHERHPASRMHLFNLAFSGRTATGADRRDSGQTASRSVSLAPRRTPGSSRTCAPTGRPRWSPARPFDTALSAQRGAHGAGGTWGRPMYVPEGTSGRTGALC